MTYAYIDKKGVRTARARITGVNCSFKDLGEVCRSIRRKPTDYALEFLGQASEMEKAIPFVRHGTGRGHRRELGGKRGGFPVKSIKAVLGLLESAQANAVKLNLGDTKVAHIIANKMATFPRMSPKGRRIRHDYETAFIEIVLEEFQKKAEKPKEAKGQKPAEQKKEAPKAEQKKEAAKAAPTAKPADVKAEAKPAASAPKAAATPAAPAKA